jgi:RNA polymerase sigma factor (sigma-70 family)
MVIPYTHHFCWFSLYKTHKMYNFEQDSELIRCICGDMAARDKALHYFFSDKLLLNSVVQFVVHNGGNTEDGRDVFQDAMVIFDRNIRAGKFAGNSQLRTYFIAIAKWHWVNLRRRKSITQPIDPGTIALSGVPENPEIQYINEERKSLLEQAISLIGARCSQLLHFYKLSYSMEEIAQEINLSSADMAKKEVYRCRERLKNHLQAQPQIAKILQYQQ